MSENNSQKEKKKRAIFVLCQKGGVGKTTWCRAYLDCARKEGLKVAAYDADGQVGQLLQYYGTKTNGKPDSNQDPLVGVGYFDVRQAAQRDTIVNASQMDADIVLMDMPGGSMQELAKVLGDGKSIFKAYTQAGFEVILVIVISHMISSVRTVSESIREFDNTVNYVVVKNLAFAKEEEFVVFDGFIKDGKKRHGKGRELLENYGGEITKMPYLSAYTYALLDVESLPFSSVEKSEDLLFADRLRISKWLEDFRKNLEGTVLEL